MIGIPQMRWIIMAPLKKGRPSPRIDEGRHFRALFRPGSIFGCFLLQKGRRLVLLSCCKRGPGINRGSPPASLADDAVSSCFEDEVRQVELDLDQVSFELVHRLAELGFVPLGELCVRDRPEHLVGQLFSVRDGHEFVEPSLDGPSGVAVVVGEVS